MRSRLRNRKIIAALVTALATGGALLAATTGTTSAVASRSVTTATTPTAIQHVVVIFDENVSFDHYFGTYPNAANTDGTTFSAAPSTPTPTNLLSNNLLTGNPNEDQPARLSPADALTCDQNHGYAPEQKAYDGGAMDQFVQNTSSDTCSGGLFEAPGLAMDYFDGNTVTAEWNYAQNFAMDDNNFGSTFGPSTPGALNLAAGSTHGVTSVNPTTLVQTTTPAPFVRSPNEAGVGTLYGDNDPAYDDCADNNHTSTNPLASMGGQNIGNVLDAKDVTWGWFQGGFTPTTTATASSSGYAVCGTTHNNVGGHSSVDYSPHHDPFQYYESTSNPHHLPPTSEAAIGTNADQANHQYDLSAFDTTLNSGNMPAVSFLKAPEYQDGHAGYSDPLDEQNFLVQQINAIQKSQFWPHTAIIVTYDDSDGWYDQVAAAITNGSDDTNADGQGDTPMCTSVDTIAGGYNDRCGPGPRLPLLVISPYSKQNYIDHDLTTQASVTRFIEDNWGTDQIGDGSFDATATSIDSMFDFTDPPHLGEVLLGSNGAVTTTPTATTFNAVTPTRILDTRNGTGGIDTPLAAGHTVSAAVTGGVIPPTATSVVLNVTAYAPTAPGFLTVFPGEGTKPVVSSLNFVAGKTVPNLVVAPIGPNGTVSFFNGALAGNVQLIADVSGYFAPASATTQGAYWSVAPSRQLDTRSGVGATKGVVAAKHSVTFSVKPGAAGVPANLTAVALNVTETQATGPGYITAYAAGKTLPLASNLNFAKSQTVPNLVIVPVSSADKVTLFNGATSGSVQLLADVQGYFVGTPPTAAGAFVALTPSRLLDTRVGTGAKKAAIASGRSVTFTVVGRGGVPASRVAATVLNITVVDPTGAGYIIAYSGGTKPLVSNLNFSANETVANLAVLPNADGTVTLFNGSPGTVELIADVSGYFLTPAP